MSLILECVLLCHYVNNHQEIRTICVLGDGNVSFEEFVSILSKSMGGMSGPSSAEQEERELRDAFRVFDKHNRGYICASDLRAVLQCLGEDLSEEESEYSLNIITITSYLFQFLSLFLKLYD